MIFWLACLFPLVAAMNPKALRINNAFIAGLIGDALALGGHYEYSAPKIKASGGFRDFSPPGEANNGVGWGTANYHPGKSAGDLTDAGDVALMLLEHLAELKKHSRVYSFDSFAHYWKRQIDSGYGSCNFQSVGRGAKGCPVGLKPGYINGGSRRTLQALVDYPNSVGQQRKNLAANVNCLVAATHFLPLFMIFSDEERLVKEAIDTVFISHQHADPIGAAEFLTRAIFRILYFDMELEHALTAAAAKTNNPLVTKWLNDAIAKVAEANNPNSKLFREEFRDDIAITTMSRLWDVGKSEPIKIGKASPTEGALPSAMYFALKYKDNFEDALIANANVGGDSAARGIVIGMLLGASKSWFLDSSHRWMTGLNALPRVQVLMDALSARSSEDL